MIREDLLNKPYSEHTIRSEVVVECDYCHAIFNRIKKTRERLNKYIKKDSCGSKECSNKKKKETYLLRYGTENPQQLESQKAKTKEANIQKFGAESYFETDEFKEKRKNSLLESLGVDSPLKSPEIIAKIKKTCEEKYGVKNYAKTEKFKEKAKVKQTVIKKIIPVKVVVKEKYTRPLYVPNTTDVDEEIKDWLVSVGFNADLHNEKFKIDVNYCGLLSRNESVIPYKDYHYNKYKTCRDKNITLLTVFEDEWTKNKEKCKGVIKSKIGIFDNRVFARKCEIKELTKEQFRFFCNTYHLQGATSTNIFSVGMFYNNELISAMSLGRHHRNTGGSSVIVLDRFCTKHGWQIVGGASRLLKFAIVWAKTNNKTTIISWSDNRWSNGNVYEKLGFTLDEDLKPDYSYVNLHNIRNGRLSKQSQKKSNNNCPPGKTENEWTKELGLARIWDCGKKRWKMEI